MSGPTVDMRLRRALTADAVRARADLAITASDSTRWASATFTGARHAITLDGTATDASETWLAALPDAELAVAGHLVADLKIVAMRQTGYDLSVTLEVLTVEDG